MEEYLHPREIHVPIAVIVLVDGILCTKTVDAFSVWNPTMD